MERRAGSCGNKKLRRTTAQDEILENYDKFEVLFKDVINYFENVKDYKGFPSLPINFNEAIEFLIKGSETEKRFMFGYLWTMFLEALRHWKVDKDALYPNSDSTPFYLG